MRLLETDYILRELNQPMITKAQQAEISSKNLQMVLAAMTAIISTLASVLIIYLQVSNNSVASREREEIKIDLKAAEIKADSKVE